MAVRYKFSADIPLALDRPVACFSSYSYHYRPDEIYFVGIETNYLIYRFLKFLDKEVKNFSIEEVKLLDETTCFKIFVSNEYNPLSKYIITYLCGVMINMFSTSEGFIKKENPEKCDWEFLAEINNKRIHNTNHILYNPDKMINTDMDLKAKWLEVLDDVEFCNNTLFKEPFKSASSYARKAMFTYSENIHVTQTAIFNWIAFCVDGKEIKLREDNYGK